MQNISAIDLISITALAYTKAGGWHGMTERFHAVNSTRNGNTIYVHVMKFELLTQTIYGRGAL